MKKIIPILILFAILFGVWWFVSKENGGVVAPAEKKGIMENISMNSEKNNILPFTLIDSGKTYEAILHTHMGDIRIALFARMTPVTVSNFVSLAKKGFYENTVFHRVISGFMIQGGDPKGDGTGGPGYQFDDENFEGEYVRGTVAMANKGPDTNGSQFFIMHADVPLPKDYVIFGKVTDGMDVVDAIASAPVALYGEGSSPITPVVVTSVEIDEK